MSGKINAGGMLGRLIRLLSAFPRHELEPVTGLPSGELNLSGLDEVGLYVHVPFCESICNFCPYNKVLYEPGLMRRYQAALRREMDLLLSPGPVPIGSVYIGGGTPTVAPELIEELAAAGPELGAGGEIAVEVLPDHASPALLRRLHQAAVTFVSIGVQSFSDPVLRYLGRTHHGRTARAALDAALVERFECVDVDLMFDPVRFGPNGVINDCEAVFRTGAHQVSVYPMMQFSYTPIGNDKLHDEHKEKQTFRRIEEIGRRHGYDRSSVWTFNRNAPGRYTSITREFYVGLGPSASSFLNQLFTVNTFDVRSYCELLEANRLPIALRSRMSKRAMMTYYLFWRFYEGRIDRRRFAHLFDVQVEQAFLPLVAFLLAVGGMKHTRDAYVLTERGFELFHTIERWVTYNFIEPLWSACRNRPFPDALRL